MIGDSVGRVTISPSQAIHLMALADVMRSGDLEIQGDDPDEVKAARDVILDVAQEVALQVHA